MKKTTLCYIEKDDKYLMLLRNKKKSDPNEGKWIGVGGHVEEGESTAECVCREVREETGLELTEFSFKGIVYFISDKWDDEAMYLYTATGAKGELKDCDEGELKWIAKSEVMNLNLWEGDKIFLGRLLNDSDENSNLFEMKLTYRGDDLIDSKYTDLHMEKAVAEDVESILALYEYVVREVNKSSIKLGWNTATYPDKSFIDEAIKNGEMCIIRGVDSIIAAAVTNHNVNAEYDDIDWAVKSPKEKIATIHALAVSPDYRGSKISYSFLKEIEDYCKKQGDIAIHLDVIDTNIPAYKLYINNGYKEMAEIEMYYEVVGARHFWMMEHEL